jgi:site-specific recombinase XerD
LAIEDLNFERVLAYLRHLEQRRGNSIRTRNHRRAALNTFYSYLALRVPEMLAACQRIAAIPVKRTSLPDTHYLEHEEVNRRCGLSYEYMVSLLCAGWKKCSLSSGPRSVLQWS